MLKISRIETNGTPKTILFAFVPARAARAAAALGTGLTALAAALVGCTVGPTFHPPPAPDATDYTRTPMPAETASSPAPGGSVQRFAPQWSLPSSWWTVFRCDELDKLIGAALADSPSLGQARARLVQAQEDLNGRRGALDYPQLDADLYARRQRINPAALGLTSVPNPGPFTLYNASVSVSYALDFFGGQRRELEAMAAQVDYQDYELLAARLSLSANIVTTAVREAALRAQIDATDKMIAAQEQEVAIVEQRIRIGAAAPVDAAAQRAQLEQTRASAASLAKQLEQTRHQLAVYAGLPPSAPLAEFRLEALHLPAELPVSLPSSLARQRPDIRAAESLLHEASANVGVATANLYPQITLSAGAGSQTTHFTNTLAGGTEVWNFGASLMQPIFHGGELRAKRRSAVAAYDQAMDAYREVVLQGLRNVADSLRALESDALALRAHAAAAAEAQYTLDVTSGQHRIGSASSFALLEAERQFEQARLQQIQSQADRLADTAGLIQALGGGWWTEPGQPPDAHDAASPGATRAGAETTRVE